MHTCIIQPILILILILIFFLILELPKQLQIVEVPCKRILTYLFPYEYNATAVVDQHH